MPIDALKTEAEITALRAVLIQVIGELLAKSHGPDAAQDTLDRILNGAHITIQNGPIPNLPEFAATELRRQAADYVDGILGSINVKARE